MGSLISEKVLKVRKEHFENLLDNEQVVSGAIPHSLSSQTVLSSLKDAILSVVKIESVSCS